MEERKVNRRGRFRWRYRTYQVVDGDRLAGQMIQILRRKDGRTSYLYQNQRLEVQLLEQTKETFRRSRTNARRLPPRQKSTWMKQFDLTDTPPIWLLLSSQR